MKCRWALGVVVLAGIWAGGVWGDAPAGPATAAASQAAGEVGRKFGEVWQLQIVGGSQGISFTNRKVVDLDLVPVRTGPNAEAEAARVRGNAARAKKIADEKIDGLVYTSEPDIGLSLTSGADTAWLVVDNSAWEKMTVGELEEALKVPEAKKGGAAMSNLKEPVTFVFRTIQGVMAELLEF